MSFYPWLQGESGQNSLKGPMGVDAAIKDYEKKFKDKTKNKWEDRDQFEPAAGKYTLIEVENATEEDLAETSEKV